MTEELKTVVDLLKTVSGDATTAIVWYLVLDFLKNPVTWGIFGITTFKIVKLITNVRSSKGVSIEDFKS